MNRSMIRYVLGHVLKIEGAFLLLPCLFAAIYREKEGFYYLIVAAICLGLDMVERFDFVAVLRVRLCAHIGDNCLGCDVPRVDDAA